MFSGLFMATSAMQQQRVAHAKEQAQAATRSLTEARHLNQVLQADIDKLFMITQALWEILKTQHGYTDELLMKKVVEIDMSDGKLDGKVAKKERPNCSSCGRKLGRTPTCLWCGTFTSRDPFER